VRDRKEPLTPEKHPMPSRPIQEAACLDPPPRLSDGAAGPIDVSPPPDHQSFLEARAEALKAARQRIARRRERKRRTS
jgi:hypothetical protein